MKSDPRAYLKLAFLIVGMPRGMSTTSSCSTLTHSTGPIPSGKTKASGAENGSVVAEAVGQDRCEHRDTKAGRDLAPRVEDRARTAGVLGRDRRKSRRLERNDDQAEEERRGPTPSPLNQRQQSDRQRQGRADPSAAGLGEHLFEDLRRASDGLLRTDFALNRPDRAGVAILVAGDNFGCGSSREHAAWALRGAGIRAVVSTSFADIFQNNALKNGIIPVVLPAQQCAVLAALDRTSTSVSVDLANQEVRWPGGNADFRIDSFSRKCLLEGVDELGYILAHDRASTDFEQQRDERGGA